MEKQKKLARLLRYGREADCIFHAYLTLVLDLVVKMYPKSILLCAHTKVSILDEDAKKLSALGTVNRD